MNREAAKMNKTKKRIPNERTRENFRKRIKEMEAQREKKK